MKKVLLITRPIAVPWDEASKNFAYFLAQNIKDVEFGLLVEKILPDLPENIKQYPIYSSGKLGWRQKMEILKVRSILKREKYDIVHFMLTPNKLNSFLFKYFLGSSAKTIQTVATLREDLYSGEDFKKILFGDSIITYSDYAKNKLADLGFINVQKINPGIDTQKYQPRPKNEALLLKFGFNKNDFILNFTGEYVRLGAIDLICETFIRLASQKNNIKLSLAARIKNDLDRQKKEEVIQKFKSEGVLEKVAFHDDGTYQMEDIFNLCDLSLFPVRDMLGKFDVPLAVIEAMACEKAVIISDLPILQEFSKPEHSVIIKSGDAQALFSEIINLYDNPEKRREIGKRAREFVLENFDIKKTALEYKKIYEQI